MNAVDAEQAVEVLRALAESQRLREEAEEGCRTGMKNCADDGGLEGWSANEIETRFRRCALVFDHGSLKDPYFETVLDLYGPSLEQASQIGHYRLITLLDGTAVDDYFVIDKQNEA